MNQSQSKFTIVCLFVVIAIFLPLSCSEEKVITPTAETVYYSDVKFILDAKCATSDCHAGAKPAAGLGLESYNQILTGSDHGPVVVNGKAEKSSLYRTMAWSSEPVMPYDEKLDQEFIDELQKWIDGGLFESRQD
ncbi:MAG: c-type cytochrome domain-containing protein [Candidatus Zixiibacteriota bacterium]